MKTERAFTSERKLSGNFQHWPQLIAIDAGST